MFNIRQQDSECLLTPEAVVQITRKLRKRRAENGHKRISAETQKILFQAGPAIDGSNLLALVRIHTWFPLTNGLCLDQYRAS